MKCYSLANGAKTVRIQSLTSEWYWSWSIWRVFAFFGCGPLQIKKTPKQPHSAVQWRHVVTLRTHQVLRLRWRSGQILNPRIVVGHPGIGFCQYETLTCPILKRICLEKYDISRSSYVSHNFHLQFTGAACHSGVHFWPLASWQFCNNWISQICCENQLCIVLHLENFFSAQRRAIFRNIHEHMGRSRQIFCIDPFCNGFSAHRTHDSVTKTQNFVTSVPCPGTFLLLSFALLRLFLVFPKVYAAVYLSSWAENRLAKLIME